MGMGKTDRCWYDVIFIMVDILNCRVGCNIIPRRNRVGSHESLSQAEAGPTINIIHQSLSVSNNSSSYSYVDICVPMTHTKTYESNE